MVTQQVTVLEDARGAQTIHLHDLSTTTRPDDGMSEKALSEMEIERDGSIKLKHRTHDAEGDVETPAPVGIKFEATR